jgi:hypothetical protein
MIPPSRTSEFSIWRACERFGVRPPGVKENWDTCTSVVQASLLAYSQLCEHDDIELKKAFAGVR